MLTLSNIDILQTNTTRHAKIVVGTKEGLKNGGSLHLDSPN